MTLLQKGVHESLQRNVVMYDVVILTDSRYKKQKKINWYIQQVLTEDGLLQNALEEKGLKVGRKDWASKDFDWGKTRYAIFRSTWDYSNRFDEFFKWIENTKNLIPPTEFLVLV